MLCDCKWTVVCIYCVQYLKSKKISSVYEVLEVSYKMKNRTITFGLPARPCFVGIYKILLNWAQRQRTCYKGAVIL